MDKDTKIQLTVWVTVFSLPILAVMFWFTKDISLLIMFGASMLIYFGFVWSPLVLMCILYHLIVCALVWFFVNAYWFPVISNLWDWLNNTVRALTYTGLIGGFVWSLFSCFDDETLGETDLGHWSISKWLPKYSWAADIKNGPLGAFTGFPASMVSIKKVDGKIKSVKPKFVIQVEIDKDPLNRKFAAVFDTSFNEQAVDTLKIQTTPSTTEDLEKIFEKALTDWLNDPEHNYTDVKGIKAKISEIQENVQYALCDARKIYGKTMSNPRVIDVQLPEDVIKQQIDEAKEITDLEGYIEQCKKLWKQFPGMTDKQIADHILTLRGINKKVTINTGGGGGGKKGKGGAIPVVTL